MKPDQRYPIGKYEPAAYSDELKEKWLNSIRFLPEDLENAIVNLDADQLATPYRDGGWTLNQVIHHLADSHINAYIRFKLGHTEEKPTIKPYLEREWANTIDNGLPINISITLLHALHARWYAFLKDFSEADFQKEIIHPEQGRSMSLWFLLGLYAWHGKHHLAHILALRASNHWN